MTNLKPLNNTTFFCRNGVHPADDCRCPPPAPYPSLRVWWADAEHRRQTLIVAAIAAIAIASAAFVELIKK